MNTKPSSITGHLKELRTRLLKSVIFLFIAFVVCYIFADKIYSFLLDPYVQAVKGDPVERRMIFTALHETFLTYLKLAFFSSFCISFPLIVIQIWKFIAPGLYKDENLFILGGMLVYYLIMPLAIKFFLSFETTGMASGMPIQLEAKVNEYLSLVTKLIFAFGLSFQLPVLLTLLGKVGFLTSNSLRTRRKYVVVMIFAAAALLTPPDPITQIGLALPLLLLYELSIFTVSFVEKK